MKIDELKNKGIKWRGDFSKRGHWFIQWGLWWIKKGGGRN